MFHLWTRDIWMRVTQSLTWQNPTRLYDVSCASILSRVPTRYSSGSTFRLTGVGTCARRKRTLKCERGDDVTHTVVSNRQDSKVTRCYKRPCKSRGTDEEYTRSPETYGLATTVGPYRVSFSHGGDCRRRRCARLRSGWVRDTWIPKHT